MLHLIHTGILVGESLFHVASGNATAATSTAIKAGMSVIPGGGFVGHLVMGKAIDGVVNGAVNGTVNNEMAGDIGRAAWDNRNDIIDSFGDGDGVAEFSDIFDGIGKLFSY